MAKASSQKFIARNRAPRVQIEYEVEVYGSQKKVESRFRPSTALRSCRQTFGHTLVDYIGAIHSMECDLNFGTHLHNGDPLTHRTVQVPSGHPKDGHPPFAWEFSATDALKLHEFHAWRDWSISGALYKAEEHNGWGVRRFHAASGPTAYLWSHTNLYRGGKYVKDHVWSATGRRVNSLELPLCCG